MRIDNSVQSLAQPADMEPATYASTQAVSQEYVQSMKLPDAGAQEALDRLQRDEFEEGFTVECNEQGWMSLRPTGDQLTGQELAGYVLEGTGDKGNELNELQQFQSLNNDRFLSPDPAARRVLAVVDSWVATMSANGQTEMTPEQKAQFAGDLAAAAKPRESDYAMVGPAVSDPLTGPDVDEGPIVVNTLPEPSPFDDLLAQGEPGPTGLPYPYKASEG